MPTTTLRWGKSRCTKRSANRASKGWACSRRHRGTGASAERHRRQEQRFRSAVNRCSRSCRSMRWTNPEVGALMSVSHISKTACGLGAVAVVVLAGCSDGERKESIGDPLSRAAKGDVAAEARAARIGGDQTDTIRNAISGTGAHNVILLIGDGMGDSEIALARDYEKGAGGFFDGIDALPLTGSYTTYALKKDGKPDYVTDSAASGTAWSTGTKTYNGSLGINISDEQQKTILELAKAQGFATGDITTSEIQDATPAAQYAHITERDCYGPDE